eukprot:Clim_evm109s210 gene=Clim_evmTU109s210
MAPGKIEDASACSPRAQRARKRAKLSDDSVPETPIEESQASTVVMQDEPDTIIQTQAAEKDEHLEPELCRESRKEGSLQIPEACRGVPCMLGIDEAGRGPVLGPMVYGVCYAPMAQINRLKGEKFADSKVLKPSERDELFDAISKGDCADYIGWRVHILSPQEISGCMSRIHKHNLNALSHGTAAGLVRDVLNSGVNLREVYVDTVGPEHKYQAYLENLFPDIDFTVCSKADAKFPIVSAASICAKVTRDEVLRRWGFDEPGHCAANCRLPIGREVGSGYPGDPNTKAWMKAHHDPIFGYPALVRFSWRTCITDLEQKGPKVTWLEDSLEWQEAQKAKAPGQVSIASALKSMPKAAQTAPLTPHDKALKHPKSLTSRRIKVVTRF